MSLKENRRLYKHYKGVIAGSHATSNTISNELRVCDATKHLADLVKKNPKLDVKEEKEETNFKGKK